VVRIGIENISVFGLPPVEFVDAEVEAGQSGRDMKSLTQRG
jgi:hypothetical protein